jgi:hypothetical protein
MQALTAAIQGAPVHAADLSTNQAMLLDDLMSSLQARKGEVASEAPSPAGTKDTSSNSSKGDTSNKQLSGAVESVAPTAASIDLQEMVQNTMQEAASAAGSIFQNTQASDAELQVLDVQVPELPMPEIRLPETKDDAMNLLFGVGAAAAGLLVTVLAQAVSSSSSSKVRPPVGPTVKMRSRTGPCHMTTAVAHAMWLRAPASVAEIQV